MAHSSFLDDIISTHGAIIWMKLTCSSKRVAEVKDFILETVNDEGSEGFSGGVLGRGEVGDCSLGLEE